MWSTQANAVKANAVYESFHASPEKDLLRRRSLRTRQEARTAVFDYISPN